MTLIRDILVSNDMFGHQVNLNLNRQDTHATMFGGFISIITKVLIGLFLYLRFLILFTEGERDSNTTYNYLLEDRERQEIYNYEDIQFMLTPGIRDVKNGKKIIDYDLPETRKYIELTYVQMFQDLENPNIAKRDPRYRYMRVKKCDFTDYQLNQETKALYEFNERRNRLYYCPD